MVQPARLLCALSAPALLHVAGALATTVSIRTTCAKIVRQGSLVSRSADWRMLGVAGGGGGPQPPLLY